ncbi:helix-turn-helix transcriptional regulator, partial [Bacillus subtilis]
LSATALNLFACAFIPETPVRIIPYKPIALPPSPNAFLQLIACVKLDITRCGFTRDNCTPQNATFVRESSVENTPWRNTQQVSSSFRMDIREIFAKNLKRLRLAKGLSQEELAHRADIDRTYVSSLERCVYGASIDVLGRLAVVLEVEPAELLKIVQ